MSESSQEAERGSNTPLHDRRSFVETALTAVATAAVLVSDQLRAVATGPAMAAVLASQDEAWNRGDAEAFAARALPENVFTDVIGMFSVGKAPFPTQRQQIFSTIYKGSQLHQQVESVFVVLRVPTEHGLRATLQLLQGFVDAIVSRCVALALEMRQVSDEPRPRREAVLSRDDTLGVSELPGLHLAVARSGEVRTCQGKRLWIAGAQRGEERLGLFAVELDAGVCRERAGAGHAASFHDGQRPHGWP